MVAPQGWEGFPCRQFLEGEASLWGDHIFLVLALTLIHPGPALDDLRGSRFYQRCFVGFNYLNTLLISLGDHRYPDFQPIVL